MKRLRKKHIDHQISIGFILWLVCFASLLCGSGIGIGMLKNRQITVRRDIERMKVEITSCQKTADYYRFKVASNTNRWAIRDRLVQHNSALKEIRPEQLESIRRDGPPARAVASTRP